MKLIDFIVDLLVLSAAVITVILFIQTPALFPYVLMAIVLSLAWDKLRKHIS